MRRCFRGLGNLCSSAAYYLRGSYINFLKPFCATYNQGRLTIQEIRYSFQFAETMQCIWTFTKSLSFLPQRKCSMLRKYSQKLRFVGRNASLFHSCFLSRSVKLLGLPPSAVTVSLHYLSNTGLPGPGGPKMPNCTSKYARQLQKMPDKLK